MPRGRVTPKPQPRVCPLCGDLPQALCHFDADFWESVKASTEELVREAQQELDEARAHLRHVAKPAA